MIARRRERATLEALQDLVRYLHGVREERKAIITVTEGWLLMRENRDMLKLHSKYEPIPGKEPIVVGPTGQPATVDRRYDGFLSTGECDSDRLRLAAMDNERFFRDILQDANRANASFYPVDPRGLAVFDTPIFASLPLLMDQAHLKTRQDGLHELAINTDGIAVMNSNDLDRGLKRISDDFASYYLLGYNSTNPKLDGTLRHLRVRVKRPGVEVRARKSYRAATMEEAESARRANEPPPPSVAAFTAAMGSLARIRPNAPLRINASALLSAGTAWVAGEIGGTGQGATAGATVDIEATVGKATATTRVTLKPGERRFLTALKVPGMAAGDLDVRARLSSEGALSATDTVRVAVGATASQPLVFRRGPTTGNRVLPAADFQFSRMERVRIDVPVDAGAKPVGAKLLDKAGNALDVPVTVSERVDEATAQRWIVADLTLAPLAAGDYAIEVTFTSGDAEQRVLTAIRLTR
jgi:hypothetical protein